MTLPLTQPKDSSGYPLVLIVILNWNDSDETLVAVDSVLKMDYGNFAVLLIDNGSTDGSVQALRKVTNEQISLVESLENLGYTGGCNIGLNRGVEMGAKYVWLLNNDAVVPPSALSSLVRLAESDPAIGLVTPMIASLDEMPRITYAGGIVSIKKGFCEQTKDLELARQWAMQYPHESLVIGTAMLVSTRLIEDIGLLEPTFFAYYEDTDYSVRSNNAGYRNVVDTSMVVRHLEKSHFTRPLEIKPHYWYYMARNENRFWRKHMGFSDRWKLRWKSSNQFLRLRKRCEQVPKSGDAILAGLWHGWLNRGGPYHPDYRMPPVVAWGVKGYSYLIHLVR